MSIALRLAGPNPQQRTFDFFVQRLPKKPYCTDDFNHGLVIRNVNHALKHSHIQPNDPRSKTWLLYDIDRKTSLDEIIDDFGLPPPTIFVQNPKNGHAHAFYGLEVALHYNTDKARLAPMRLAAAIERGMTRAMSADASFAGLICKNPLHERWRTYATGSIYDLTELSDWVPLDVANDARIQEPQGLGRNCDTFEVVRKWAYKQIRAHEWPRLDEWVRVVNEKAVAYNASAFSTPLDQREVAHIATSIAKWTFKHMSAQGFSAWQAVQGRKGGKASGKTRAAASEDKRASARLLASQGSSSRAIAHRLGVNQSTVVRWLKG